MYFNHIHLKSVLVDDLTILLTLTLDFQIKDVTTNLSTLCLYINNVNIFNTNQCLIYLNEV